MTAEAVVNTVINNAITRSNKAADKAETYSDQAQTAAGGYASSGPILVGAMPPVTLPPFNPEEDLGAAFTLAFDNAVADFDGDLKREIADFLDDWFPSWDGCLKSAVDPWVCSTINGGGVGLPVAVENAIWARERERELMETSRLQSESVDAFAARGFSLPGGLLVDEQSKISYAGANKISAASRDRAIKEAEIRIDMLKFAVEKGVQMRLGVLDALVNFLNVFLKVPALAIEKARTLTDAKTKLWDQSSNYHRALIAVAELLFRYKELEVNTKVHQQDIDVNAFTAKIQGQVGAAVAAAEAMGAIAGSALGSLNSLGEISHTTIANASST